MFHDHIAQLEYYCFIYFNFKILIKNELLLNRTYLVTYLPYSTQPLKSFDFPLMRVSLSNSILVTLIFY